MHAALITIAVFIMSLELPLTALAGADFSKVNRLRNSVRSDLATINSYVANRERLVKDNQGSTNPGAIVPYSAGIMLGVQDIKTEFDHLDTKTTEAEKDSTFSPSELLKLETDWTFLQIESSTHVASLGSTPPYENGDVLIQYVLDFNGKPATGWRVGSVGYFKVPRDRQARETEIVQGCKEHLPPFIRSNTISAKIKMEKLKKDIAFIEQRLPPGQKYFWVQDEDCTSRSSPASYEDTTKVVTGNCVPFDRSMGGCYPVYLSAPAEKPKPKSKEKPR